ncbi:MAG: flagellar basal body rod protein FlgB [Gammaproteobacteria bacterium]|nr:MAG: flagellar basal body rod protein FlgB [Gammaproteobacteria bacterium]
MNALDRHLGIHAQALLLWERRAELIAANLANADTPHYKARDIDFAAVLAGRATGLTPARSHPDHLGPAERSAPSRYRLPLHPSLDGNTVETQVEHALFAENALRYQMTLDFLGRKFSGLVRALRGE